MKPEPPMVVLWEVQTTDQINHISAYLRNRFSQREVAHFHAMLQDFEQKVASFPDMFPATKRSRLVHRAVLSKELSIYYYMAAGRIHVFEVIDNRQDQPY